MMMYNLPCVNLFIIVYFELAELARPVMKRPGNEAIFWQLKVISTVFAN